MMSSGSAPRLFNLTVSHDPPFVWYRVAKVGTITTYTHLANHVRQRLDKSYAVPLPESGYEGYFHFAFVRNPWDRLVSCWHDKVLRQDHFELGSERERMRSFAAFVEYVAQLDLDHCDPHLRRQAALLDLDRVDFIGRFERFAEDLSIVCSRLGLPAGFGHRHATDHRHYSAYYDDRTAETVGRLYAPDVRAFGYEFARLEQWDPYAANAAPVSESSLPWRRRWRRRLARRPLLRRLARPLRRLVRSSG